MADWDSLKATECFSVPLAGVASLIPVAEKAPVLVLFWDIPFAVMAPSRFLLRQSDKISPSQRLDCGDNTSVKIRIETIMKSAVADGRILKYPVAIHYHQYVRGCETGGFAQPLRFMIFNIKAGVKLAAHRVSPPESMSTTAKRLADMCKMYNNGER